MFIDLIFLLLMILAIFKGFTKGLIVAVFSLVSFIVGLAAALKLSAVFAQYLQEETKMEGRWLPFLAFIIIFIGVALLIRWAAKLLKGAVSLAMLGWLDTLGGIILYALLYTFIFSVVLFFATRLHLVSPETAVGSKTYSYIEPWGPRVISAVGSVLPWFKNIFADLQHFFSGVAAKHA